MAAAQEERFTRLKGDARFPCQAIAYCLNEAGIDVAHLDYVAFYEKPLVKFERLLETYLTFAPRGFPSFRRALPLWGKHKLRLPQRIRAELGRSFEDNSALPIITNRMRPVPFSLLHFKKLLF